MKLPKGLTKEAKEILKEIEPLLASLDYQDTDQGALYTYCQAYAYAREAQEQIKETGGQVLIHPKTGALYPNPWVAVWRHHCLSVKQAIADLGFSPACRRRMKQDLEKIEFEADDLP